MPDRNPAHQHLYWDAVANLTEAYRLLGDAADDLRGLGEVEFLQAVGEAKAAINRAKDEIRA